MVGSGDRGRSRAHVMVAVTNRLRPVSYSAETNFGASPYLHLGEVGAEHFGQTMPRYFFDIDDGRRRVHDQAGMDLPSEDSATKEAGFLLQALAQVRHIERRPGVTTVRVRDGEDEHVYEGSTCLER